MGSNTWSSAGTYTWTAPITGNVTVQCWGAGGAGGSSADSGNGYAGGGGGAFASSVIAVVSGNNYTVVVGAGGTSTGSHGSNGAAGAATTFNSTSVVAAGGQGGMGSSYGSTGGAGGTTANSTGTTKYAGGQGGNVSTTFTSGEGGGSSAGTGANGTSAGSNNAVGATAPSGGGSGGNGGASNMNGNVGLSPGGGGGGAGAYSSATTGYGGSGADGQCIITWTITNYSVGPITETISAVFEQCSNQTPQDYTGYTESDSGGYLTVNSSTQITVAAEPNGGPSYVYKDAGAAHYDFEYDWSFMVHVNVTSASGANLGVWGLSNSLGTRQSVDGLDVYLAATGGNVNAYIEEIVSGTIYTSSATSSLALATDYYLVIQITRGTSSVISLSVYSDSGLTTQVGSTVTLTLHNAVSYRYIYGVL